MSIRRSTVDRINEARKSSVPTIGKGKPLDARGSDGDIAFRRTSGGLKLYIKANHKWHGVKVGESFDSLEKKINEIKSKVDTIKQFRLPSTYSVTGDFTLDASGDIELNADGGQVTIKDGTATHFVFDCDNTRFAIYDDANELDKFYIEVNPGNGATEMVTNDNDGTSGDLTLNVDGDIELNADGGQVTIKDTLASHFLFDCDNTKFTMYDDANANDYFSIAIEAEGATTISTVDADTAVGHLTLDPDGELNLTPVTEVKSDAPLKIKEAANAVADTAAYGQLWVKTATPNNLYFTDDAGNDIQLTSGLAPFIKYQYETKVTNFYSTATANYLPLSGGTVETTSTLGKTENVCIVAPFNGTLERAVFRSEIAQNGDLIFAIHESSDGTEAPALGSVGSKTTAINIADDTAQIVDFDSMTSGSNVITKGRIYAIKLTAPSGPQDTVITLVFKWDATS